ncbi:glycosyltransferase family 9 protein [Candidatus Chlorohelix sp.]|uniref:glycosyltransferase family 9 protein n=1 Tax=Candidatus Chlorohelix sp. TaxID=3139201 RepID=UPI003029EB5B
MSEQKLGFAAAPGTILVIPFADGIGDFVNMQPILRAIAQKFPKADISVAASAYANYLITPDLNVKIVTPSWFEKEPGPMAQRLRHLISQKVLAWFAGPVLKRELGGNIDLIINTFYLWERNMDFPRYWTPQNPPRPGARHTLDCLAQLLEEELDIEIPQEKRYPNLWITPSASEWATNFIAENNLTERQPVALVAESNMKIKKWKAAEWAYLSDTMQEKGHPTLFFAPPDSELIKEIFNLTRYKPLYISTSLDNVTALLKHCSLCVGVDTGLLHIASAIGTPWVGLFGPTNPEVTGPYNRAMGRGVVSTHTRGEGCRNCWKSFKYEDDHCLALNSGSCMDSIDRHTVVEISMELLEAAKVSRL